MISRIDNTPLLLRSADDRHVGRIDSLPANENNISAGNMQEIEEESKIRNNQSSLAVSRQDRQ